MLNLYIPITMPFWYDGDVDKFRNTKFSIPINQIRELTKHKGYHLEYILDIIHDHNEFLILWDVDHAWINISERVVEHYVYRFNKTETITLHIKIKSDIDMIVKEYSASEDIYRDIILGLINYLHGLFNLAWYIRFSPIFKHETKWLLFNVQLAYMINPWQDQFTDVNTLLLLLNLRLKIQIKSKNKYYELIHPHVVNALKPLELDVVTNSMNYSFLTQENISIFSRTMSEIVRLNPAHDFSLMIGMLTAMIEWFLKIDGENRYKFKIKISNLLNDQSLGKVLNEIYDLRSSYFHTVKPHKINDIFEFLHIEFLLLVIKKIIIFSISEPIEKNTFDFYNKP